MALQKVFAATTGIVGIFICVDYGLCDEFRCHGNEIPKSALHSEAGWQGSAFWSLAYALSIILWTLHLSLIEGELIVMSSQVTLLFSILVYFVFKMGFIAKTLFLENIFLDLF